MRRIHFLLLPVSLFCIFLTALTPDPSILVNAESSEEEVADEVRATRIKEVFFKPKDDDLPPDRRYDLYEDQPSDWVFTWQLLEYLGNGTFAEPIRYAPIWVNISFGSYMNSTCKNTDIRGRVHLNFSSRFKDTSTRNTFTFTEEFDTGNMTIQVSYSGNEINHGCSKIYFCSYHKETHLHGHGHGIYGSTLLLLTCGIWMIIVTIVFTITWIIYNPEKGSPNRKNFHS